MARLGRQVILSCWPVSFRATEKPKVELETFIDQLEESVSERDRLAGRISFLSRHIEARKQRLAEIPSAIEKIKTAHFQHMVQQGLNPVSEGESRAGEFDLEIQKLTAQTKHLEEEVQAFAKEEAKARREWEQLKIAIDKREERVWTTVTEDLRAQFPADLLTKFMTYWAAMDILRDGIHASSVLLKAIGFDRDESITTADRLRIREELRARYGIPTV